MYPGEDFSVFQHPTEVVSLTPNSPNREAILSLLGDMNEFERQCHELFLKHSQPPSEIRTLAGFYIEEAYRKAMVFINAQPNNSCPLEMEGQS